MGKRRPAKARGRKRAPTAADLERLSRELATLKAQQAVLLAALGLRASSKKGERGRVGELNDAVIKIQDYLLRTGERLDGILGTLKNHRELLVQMSQRIYQVGTRERIRLELDIMRNTLAIVALNGVRVEGDLLAEVEKVRAAVEDEAVDVVSLRRSKAKLDKRFDGTVGKLDLSAIYRQDDEDIPGYG